ncbi:MAG TPA: DHH family phosphoesterase [Thermoplasmata archaeon]|nr:DHH family phosphoesterase [Thermoplasmata archaeon]
MEIENKIKKARAWVDEEDYIRVVSHHDVDGISSASIILNFLKRNNKKFYCSLLRNVNRELLNALDCDEKLCIIADMGSAYIDEIEKLDKRVIILDHHLPKRESKNESVLQINPHLHDINGSAEACASTLSYFLANEMDLISFMIAGALGDRQGSEFSGLNKTFVDEAIEKGIIKKSFGVTIDCYDNSNLQRKLETSIAPFFKDISGRNGAGEKISESLKGKSEKTVNSTLLLELLKQGCREEVTSDLLGYVYSLPFRNMNSNELLSLFNVCDGLNMAEVGLSMALGDEKSYSEVIDKKEEYYKRALSGLVNLEKSGAIEKSRIQYFYSDNLAMSGLYASISMNYFLDQEKATLALTKTKEHLKISARGTRHLVKNGLNLAIALKEGAERVKGNGGGHDIAAGATVPLEEGVKFLDTTDEIIVKQMSR